VASRPHEVHECPSRIAALCLWFRMKLVSTVGTAIRVFEPFLDAMVTKNVSAFGQAKRGFFNTLRSLDTIVIIADNAIWKLSAFISARTQAISYFCLLPVTLQAQYSEVIGVSSWKPPSLSTRSLLRVAFAE
jgi:hypothetical protein